MFDLTETRIRAARTKDKPYKLTDGRGLHLLVTPAGSRLWRFRYRHEGREGMAGVGAYPRVSLKEARERVEAARKALEKGVTPAAQRRAERTARDSTFATIAQEWLSLRHQKLTERTLTKTRWMLNTFVFPKIGTRPISKIEALELLPVLRKIETKNAHETAHRTKQICGRIFRYAVVTGRAARDPCVDLKGALAPIKVTNRSAILDPAKGGELLRAIDGYSGYAPTQFALKLAPLLFARPGELRAAEWSEFDIDASEWRIRAARMKMRELHIVPLATQAVALLRDLKSITGDGK
jgi:integrase